MTNQIERFGKMTHCFKQTEKNIPKKAEKKVILQKISYGRFGKIKCGDNSPATFSYFVER